MSEKKPIRYAFLQIPNYSMVTFSSAVASLRGANRLWWHLHRSGL
jgi:transcriptional regulator GlxA family with amidase domain